MKVFFFGAILSAQTGLSCNLTAYMSDSVLGSSWFGPGACGAPAWSSECVGEAINQMTWRQTLHLDTRFAQNRISQGILAYFVLEYNPSLCNANYTVSSDDAQLIGTRPVDNKGKIQKLYGVLGAYRQYDLLVQLSRGILVNRAPRQSTHTEFMP